MTSSQSTKLMTTLWRHVSTYSWACWETSGRKAFLEAAYREIINSLG
jgi:hypothetical protein